MEDVQTPYPPGAYPPTPNAVGGASTPRGGIESPLDIAGRAIAIDGSGPSTQQAEPPHTVDKLLQPAPGPQTIGDVSPLSHAQSSGAGPETPLSEGAALASAFLASENQSSAARELEAPQPAQRAQPPLDSPAVQHLASGPVPVAHELPSPSSANYAAPSSRSVEPSQSSVETAQKGAHNVEAQSSGSKSGWTAEGAAAAAAFLAGGSLLNKSDKSSAAPQTSSDRTPTSPADSSISSPTAALLHDHAPASRDPSPPQPNAPTDDHSSIAAVRDMAIGGSAGSSVAGTPTRGLSSENASALAPALTGAAIAGAGVTPIVYARQGSFPASAALGAQAPQAREAAPASAVASVPVVPSPAHHANTGSVPVVEKPSAAGHAKTASPSHSKSSSRDHGHGGHKGAVAAGAVGAGAGSAAAIAHQRHISDAEAKRDRILNSATHSQDPTAKYNTSPRASTEHERPHKLVKAPVAPSARQTRDLDGSRKSIDSPRKSVDSPRKSIDSPRKSLDEAGNGRRGSFSWRRTRDSPASSAAAATSTSATPDAPVQTSPTSKPKGLRRLSWRRSTENMAAAKGEVVPPVPLLKSETPEERQRREASHAEKREPSHVDKVAKQAAMDPNAPAPGSDAYHHLGHHKMPPTHTQVAAARANDSPSPGRKSVTIDDRTAVAEPKETKERHGLSSLFRKSSKNKA